MNKVGFIGVGIMGKSMVRNLMKAGFELKKRKKIEQRWRWSYVSAL